MTEQIISNRYAKAVMSAAQKINITELMFNDFVHVRNILASSKELRQFLKSPVIRQNDKIDAIKNIFSDSISDLSMTFLVFLIIKGRAYLMLDIIKKYFDQYNEMNGRVRAHIATAIEINDETRNMIIEKIKNYTGKEIIPDFSVNPEIEGGLVVRIKDWIFDASFKNQLNRIFNELAKN